MAEAVDCTITKCMREVHARGMCEPHYRRMLRGKPISNNPIYTRNSTNKTDEERFLSMVHKTKSCWLWVGGKTTAGYGEFQSNKKTRYAHRWSYQYFIGDIPEGLHIDHLCSVRNCVNPSHLEPVTIQENSRRQAERIRNAKAI